MSSVFRFAGWLLLAVVLLVVILLLVLRFNPGAAVWATNKALDGTQISLDAPELRYFPPSLQAATLTVQTAEQNINVVELDASADLTAWWSDQPYWQASVASVAIEPTGKVPEPANAEPISFAIPNLTPLFSFTKLHLGELTMGKPAELRASLDALREGADSKLTAQVEQGDARYNLTGTVASTSGQPLGFDLNVDTKTLTPDPEAALINANITGTLASTLTSTGDDTRITFTAGKAKLTQGEISQTLDALEGAVDIPASGASLTLTGIKARLTSPEDQLADLPLELGGTASFVADDATLDLTGKLGDTSFSTESTVNAGAPSAKGTLTVTSTGLPDSIATAPYAATQVFPASLSTEYEFSADTLALSDLILDTPVNKLTGTATLATAAPWKLIADIQAEQLYVPLVGDSDPEVDADADADADADKAEEVAETATADAGRTFSEDPIDWSWLNSAELDLKLAAAKFALQDAVFSDLKFALKNADGTLTLEPLSASIDDGGFSTKAKIQLADSESANSPVAITADFELAGVLLETFGLAPPEELSGGKIEADVQLTTNGNSAAELAGGLQGEILLIVEEAQLMNDFVELVGSDLIMETLNKLNPFAKKDPTTELECALVRLSAVDGKLTTKNQLVMETTKMQIVGTGDINLNDEKLNIGITPNAKSGVGINIGSAVKFMKLGGTLTNPRPAVSAGGLLKSGLAIGAAISTGGASVVAEGVAKRALGNGSVCEKARKDHAEKIQTTTSATGE